MSKLSRAQRAAPIVAALAAISSAPAAAAGQAAKIDVTGKWTFTVETSAGSGTPTVTLKQNGQKLTGHYSSANLGGSRPDRQRRRPPDRLLVHGRGAGRVVSGDLHGDDRGQGFDEGQGGP